MAKSGVKTKGCEACQRADGDLAEGPDHRRYCEECGEMMRRMERMFVPEGAILKEAPKASPPARTAPPAAPPRRDPPPPSPPPVARKPVAAPVAKSEEGESGGFGKFLVIVVLLAAAGGGAWKLGYLGGSTNGGPTPDAPAKETPVAPPKQPANTAPPVATPVRPVENVKVEGVIDASDGAAMQAAMGKDVVIEGRVLSARSDDGNKFLRVLFGTAAEAFEARIPARRFNLFRVTLGRNLVEGLVGKNVRIRGRLTALEGRPLIVLDVPSQIEVLGG